MTATIAAASVAMPLPGLSQFRERRQAGGRPQDDGEEMGELREKVGHRRTAAYSRQRIGSELLARGSMPRWR